MTELARVEPDLPVLRGKPPARSPGELIMMLQTQAPHLVEPTATWIVSGDRESAHTHEGYAIDIAWWLHWCQMRGMDPADPRPMDADQYAAALAANGLSKATRARRLAAASSLYKYLVHRAGCVPANPFAGMERPKADKTSPTRHLTDRQIEQLLGYAHAQEDPRTFALLAVLYLTGVRSGAIIRADVGDVGYNAGECVIRVRDKGNELREVVLDAFVCGALEVYQTNRSDGPADSDNPADRDRPLFATATGKRLDRPYLLRMLRRVARKAGIPGADKLSPHSLRHSLATNALEDGVPLDVVQDMLGHANPSTTRRYDRRGNNAQKAAAHAIAAKVEAGIDRYTRDHQLSSEETTTS